MFDKNSEKSRMMNDLYFIKTHKFFSRVQLIPPRHS